MIIPYHPNPQPLGFFDFLDTQLDDIKGGEVVVFDNVASGTTDQSAPDVYAGSPRSVVRKALSNDIGPFFFVDADRNHGALSQVNLESNSLFSTAAPHVSGKSVAGKLALYAAEGFYALTTDVVDSITVNVNTEPNTRLYVDDDGLISATPSGSAALIGFFIEYRQKSATTGFPHKFNYAGTSRDFDTVVVYKSNADGYLNLEIDFVRDAIGSTATLGTPTDGYFSDGYVSGWNDSTTIADAIDDLNEGLLTVSNALVESANWRVTETIAQRNAIPIAEREEGMRVRVSDLDTTFELVGGTTNSDWVAVEKENYNYISPGSTVTIYVETWGDDGYGDGSVGNPYRQPQRALDSIPDGATGTFIIQCGPGQYSGSIICNINPGDNLTICIVGNRSNPTLTFDSAPSFSKVSGKESQYEATTDPFSGVTDNSHWLEIDLSSVAPYCIEALPVMSSSSPTLRVAGTFSSSFITAVHPFETEFTGSTFGAVASTRNFAFTIVGVHLSSISESHNIGLLGCLCDGSSLFMKNSVFLSRSRHTVYVRFEKEVSAVVPVGIGNNRLGGLFDNRVLIYGSNINVRYFISRSNTYSQLNVGADEVNSSIRLLSADFEGTVDCIDINTRSNLYIFFSATVSNDPPLFANITQSSYIEIRSGETVTGTTTGVPIVLENGSEAVGIEAGCNGNLTNSSTPGDEIKVGGSSAPANSFSDLPITDATTLCRAT